MNDRKISPTSLRRFPKYLAIAKVLLAEGWTYITSADLARACDMQEILVRKDLSQTGIAGKQHCGYFINEVISVLTNVVGWDRHNRMIVVGAGRMAHSLVGFSDIAKCNVSYEFMVDNDPMKIGTCVEGVPVISNEDAIMRLKENPIRLAAITVPPEKAQVIADMLVSLGVKAIMNFTSVTLTVPDDVKVSDADIFPHLATLTHWLT